MLIHRHPLAWPAHQAGADAHCGLDFPASHGRALVPESKARRLSGDALKDVVDERVHDRHGLAGDASVGMNLLQPFVDVDSITSSPSCAARGPRLGIAFSAPLDAAMLIRDIPPQNDEF